MQKQAPTLGRLLTMVLFALSCFGLLLFLWLSFGGPMPLKPKGYRVQGRVPGGHAARPRGRRARRRRDASARSARRSIDPSGPNRTIATIEIDARFAPIAARRPRDPAPEDAARRDLRRADAGHRRRAERIPEGGWLADAQRRRRPSSSTRSSRRSTRRRRQAFRTLAAGPGRGRRGPRPATSTTRSATCRAFAADADDVLGVLDAPGGRRAPAGPQHRRRVRRADRERGASCANLITNAGDVVRRDARASRRRWPRRSAIFPTFLDESKATFARLRDASPSDTDPLIQDLRPAAARPAARRCATSRALAPDLETFFRNLDPLITASKNGLPALRDILDGAKPLLGQLQPFLEELNPILEWLEYHQTHDRGLHLQRRRRARPTRSRRAPSDERGHYLRQFGPTGPGDGRDLPQPRSAANRGNAYLDRRTLAAARSTRSG